MSKTLILFRHAHAEWQSVDGVDHDRVLSVRGEEEAKIVGLLLKQQQQVPQQIFCSSAQRAESTLNIALAAGEWSCPITIDKTLYNADTRYVLTFINKLSDDYDRAMLVGHEPTWSDVTNHLLNDRSNRISFSTATMVAINFGQSTWSSIEPGSGEFAWSLGPRQG